MTQNGRGYPWQNLARIMARHGVTRKSWADRAGIAPSTLYNWEKRDRVSGQGTTYEKLARAIGMEPDQFLAALRGVLLLPKERVPVLERSDIDLIRARNGLTSAAFSDRPLLPILPAETESDTMAAVRLEDAGVDKRAPRGAFAIIDWSRREPLAGRAYLIHVQGQYLVRRYQVAPELWVPDSHDSYPTIQPSEVEVVAVVTSFYIPE